MADTLLLLTRSCLIFWVHRKTTFSSYFSVRLQPCDLYVGWIPSPGPAVKTPIWLTTFPLQGDFQNPSFKYEKKNYKMEVTAWKRAFKKTHWKCLIVTRAKINLIHVKSIRFHALIVMQHSLAYCALCGIFLDDSWIFPNSWNSHKFFPSLRSCGFESNQQPFNNIKTHFHGFFRL